MLTLWQDLRYSTRLWLKEQRGFALIAVVTLALGIGANATIFSFVNGILLRPLPYPEQDRLAVLWETSYWQGAGTMGASFLDFQAWREQNRVFEDIGCWFGGYFTLTGNGEPEQLLGASVSPGVFEILRVAPVLGRTFTAEEGRPGHDAVIILSYGLWQRRFGGDPNIIGTNIIVNNNPRTVVGVMPRDFKFPDTRPLWVPNALDVKTEKINRLGTIARLKAGVSFEQAQAEMTVIAQRLQKENPATHEGLGVIVTNMHNELAGKFRESLLILLVVVGCVLLVACANVANLMLARATARQKELAIRTALGASRWRIIRLLLTESLLLGAAGGAVGLLLARFGINLLLAAIPIELPFWMNFDLDWRVIGFTFGLSVLTVLVFGVAPALQASRPNLNSALKEGASASIPRQRSRRLLVITEIALSFVLLVGAGLMIQSFLRLHRVNPGFNPSGLLTLKMTLPVAKYHEPEQLANFFSQLLDRVRALPGVEAAGAVQDLPLSGGYARGSLAVEGRQVPSDTQAPMLRFNIITPGYFHAIGVSLLMGRDFSEADKQGSEKVTIIDQRVARDYWPTESPIGKRVRYNDNEDWYKVVGVVGSALYERLDAEVERTIYLPTLQNPTKGMSLVLRTQSSPTGLIGAVRNQIRELDPYQPVIEVRTMEEVVAGSVWEMRLYTILFMVFAAVTLLLATVGIYGVTSYMVNARTHEIGIRMAIGAKQRDVLTLVVGQGMWLTFGGVALGGIASFVLTMMLKHLLFGIGGASDLLVFVLVGVLLTMVALVACYIPARRAARVDPMVVLK